MYSLWVIRRRLHIHKIHKNKIHFYNYSEEDETYFF